MKNISLKIILIAIAFFSIETVATAQKKLNQDDIDQYGTKTISANIDTVYAIVKQVLLSRDYIIDIDNKSKGLIKTNRKQIGSVSTAVYGAYSNTAVAQSRATFRQYYVNIESLGDNAVKIVFTPKIYVGDSDISDKKIWVLKGAAGEYKLWEDLFKDITDRLP